MLMLLVITILPLKAQQILQQTIQLQQSQGTVQEILQDLQQNEGIRFSYDESILSSQQIKLGQKQWLLKNLLKKLAAHSQLEFRYLNGQIILKKQPRTRVKLSGTIKAAGEQLPGATIYVNELKTGSVADANGHYSLFLPPGKYTSVFSFIGHQQESRMLRLNQDTTMQVSLNTKIDKLDEVTIKGEKKGQVDVISEIGPGKQVLSAQAIKVIPQFGGEVDVAKSLQLLPGVQSGFMGTSIMSVRGGSYEQNLVLLDGLPIYNTSHAMGFFSIFNADALEQVQLYKGNIPAKYGGRLSSVIELKTKDDIAKKLTFSGGIGLTNSRLNIETPIGKKTSLMVSGRFGYPESIYKTVASTSLFENNYNTPLISFYSEYHDVIVKLKTNINERNRLSITALYANDRFTSDDLMANDNYKWRNLGGVVNWQHSFTPRLKSNFRFIFSNYRYGFKNFFLSNNQYGFTNLFLNNHQEYRWSSSIQQLGINLDFDYEINQKQNLNFGLAITQHQVRPGGIEIDDNFNNLKLDAKNALEYGLFVTHHVDIGKRLNIDYGIRLSGLLNVGKGTRYVYNADQTLEAANQFGPGEIMDGFAGVEPRLSVNYLLTKSLNFNFAYNRTYQYLHQLGNSAINLPTDVWHPADNNLKPRFADQASLGMFWTFGKDKQYTFSTEFYYRRLHRIIDFKDNADLFMNSNVETEVRTGQGEAKGMEVMFQKKSGSLQGSINYTLSDVTHHIPDINQGQSFAPGYNRLHKMALMAFYDLDERWRFSVSYSYMTGANITVPEGIFIANDKFFNYYSARNNYQLPDFHQLDFNITLKSKKRKRWQGEWIFGVTNFLNQKNTLTIFRDNAFRRVLRNNTTQFVNIFLFGRMLSLTYNFKF